jgi:hypothetical protein
MDITSGNESEARRCDSDARDCQWIIIHAELANYDDTTEYGRV